MLSFGTMFSVPMIIHAESKVTGIDILTLGTYPPGQTNYAMGQPPDTPFTIKLTGPPNTDFTGYMAGAAVYSLDNSSEISLGNFQSTKYGISSTSNRNPYFINFFTTSFEQSDKAGIVHFRKLSVMDCNINSVTV